MFWHYCSWNLMKGHHHIFTNFWMWLMSFFETYHWSLPRFQLASNPILKSALTGALKVTLHCTTRTEKVHLKIKAHLALIVCKRQVILRLKYKFSISERSDFYKSLNYIPWRDPRREFDYFFLGWASQGKGLVTKCELGFKLTVEKFTWKWKVSLYLI